MQSISLVNYFIHFKVAPRSREYIVEEIVGGPISIS